MEIDRSVIGQWGPELTMREEHGKIREFARAIKDPNPAFAGDAPLAPPTFLMTSQHWMEPGSGGGPRGVKLDMRRVLHGEQEFDYVKPIRAGELLTVRSRTKDIFEKDGSRGGKMLFMVMESEYRNRQGEVVAYSRSTTIQTEGTVKS